MEDGEMTLRLNPELSRKVWKLAYYPGQFLFHEDQLEWADILKALEEVDVCKAFPLR